MTNAYHWNNIGFRWSDEIMDNDTPYGLQVFVNGSSIAWKRGPYNSGATGKPAQTASDIQVTVGCSTSGLLAQQGTERGRGVGGGCSECWKYSVLITQSAISVQVFDNQVKKEGFQEK